MSISGPQKVMHGFWLRIPASEPGIMQDDWYDARAFMSAPKRAGYSIAKDNDQSLLDEVPTTPLCDIPSGCCSYTGLWRYGARPMLLLVSFPRSRSAVFGVLGLC